MLGSIIGTAMNEAIKRATQAVKNRTSNTSKNNSTVTTTSNKSTGGNYAYDPSGNKVNVTIKNGQSYLDSGERVGAGYTVQTNGGIYKMGDDGKGYKVDAHNVATTPQTKKTWEKSGDYNYSPNFKNPNHTPLDDFSNSYQDALMNIYDTHKVDNSVLRSMFESDMLHRDNPNYKRYGTFDITEAMINGYNNAYDKNMQNIANKVNGFSDDMKNSDRGKLYLDAVNRYKNGGQSGNPNIKPEVYNNYKTPQMIETPISTPSGEVVNTNALISTPTNTEIFVPITPNGGGVGKTADGKYFVSEDEYQAEITPVDIVNIFTELYGF